MKSKIRAKLITVFFIPVLITVTLIVLSFVLLYVIYPTGWHQQGDETNTYKLFNSIEDNYNNIDDYDEFYETIKPLLNKCSGRLQVVNSNGIILFDSLNRNNVSRDIGTESFYNTLEKMEAVYDNSFMSFHPVFVKGKYVAGAFLNKNGDQIERIIKQKVIMAMFYFIGLIILVILILAFIKKFSLSILKTVDELNEATDNIIQGNLDFKINCVSDDELGQFCEAFNTMREQLKGALEKQAFYEQSRKELLAAISHDLRTPMTSIKGYVEGLQLNIIKDEAKFNRYLSVIKEKTNRLDRLIEDLFQISQFDIDRFHIQLEEVDSDQLFREILQEIEMDNNDSFSKVIIHEEFPSVDLKIDKHRIKQVIDNLLANAKNYSLGNAEILLQIVASGDYLEVSVKDNGIGISPQDLHYIFDRFYQGEKSRSTNYGGVGLGLAICKYIVEEHGGNIWAESIVGQGSTFYFTLPISRANN